ncbi:hypothetical protein [Streptomyces sp. TLI_146]|uniref:hypothetical protein n=1 Tax=Streptomyces sp. TLI_146 TaxID=1938858 RepID=UPI000C708F55|nr:hypothetical protein [Streptomyces sp. TLI_146]PKV82837.1 hypothetical protein BX283_0301 [Streptomyces sp. TLI_146]
MPQMSPAQQPQHTLTRTPIVGVLHAVADLAQVLHQLALHPEALTETSRDAVTELVGVMS